MASPDDPRTQRLHRTFTGIVSGKAKLSRQNFKLFLEAVVAQDDRASCLTRLYNLNSSPLQEAFRMDLSPAFLNGPVTSVLQYLQDPKLKEISGGDYLHDILLQIVDPPIFWTAFTEAFRNGDLSRDGQLSFAFLLHDLVSNPSSSSNYRPVAQDSAVVPKVLQSPDHEIRTYGYKIKDVLETFQTANVPASLTSRPGGRHDNDFADFRGIAIMPTADEIRSTEPPFLLPSTAFEQESHRSSSYLDSQFRLLREDMLSELREELHIALGQKQGKRRGRVIEGLKLVNVFAGSDERRQKWSLVFQCSKDLWFFEREKPKDRAKFLKDDRKSIRHQSLCCLIADGDILAFPIILREEALLALKLPRIPLQFQGEASTLLMLERVKSAKKLDLLLIDTAVFAYEPVLRALQEMTSVPLKDELLYWSDDESPQPPPNIPRTIVSALQHNAKTDVGRLLGLQSIVLDPAQAASLLSALKQRVSLIQGPPGTGKSFIGSLLAKILHDQTSQTILVCCYTNHALDQFLEDMIGVGIPRENMVRLGGRPTTALQDLSLRNQQRNGLDYADRSKVREFKQMSEQLVDKLDKAFKRYQAAAISTDAIMEYLEFEEDFYEFYEAFQVPVEDDGSVRVGRGGRAIDEHYLLDRWMKQLDGGIFSRDPIVTEAPRVWKMSTSARQDKIAGWQRAICRERAEEVYNAGQELNHYQDMIARKYRQSDVVTMGSKRIIACTTTGAAMFGDTLRQAAPGVLLVEEAGEILESHVLAAMSENTTQMILIGDHQQLRPKVNSYQLSVEKGEGYDLNVSLFERLVLKGYPHHTLLTQHRMRPEISSFIRALTYPDLLDSPKANGRPNLRGIRDNVVFVKHSKPEDENRQLATGDAPSHKSSKQNTFEAEMVLKVLHYLGQQGYGTDNIVILTPYLGQLKRLQDALRGDNEPILSDLDVQDLIRAGATMPMAAKSGKSSKKAIRISTIDNYQGEESDIVLVSLTRSNTNHDIGFMFAPERLNVLISRARNALIIIGNDDTFRKSRKGGDLWRRFFALLEKGNHVYDGFPVRCERHRTREINLREPKEFMQECPNGGCTQACGALLSCKQHRCLSKCHLVQDHGSVRCTHPMEDRCTRGHTRHWACYDGPPAVCPACAEETKKEVAAKQRAAKRKVAEEEETRRHLDRLAKLDDQIRDEMQRRDAEDLKREREEELARRKADLDGARRRSTPAQSAAQGAQPTTRGPQSTPQAAAPDTSTASNTQSPSIAQRLFSVFGGSGSASGQQQSSNAASSTPATPPGKYVPKPLNPSQSASEQEWRHRKAVEGKSNEHVDNIMELVGLEAVKQQVLTVMDKIEIAKQQGTSLKDQRFNVAFLGNPGTGKTTVAREYAKFLTSMRVLPGDVFLETTGSFLASEGTSGVKDLIKNVLTAGGGAIFVDEAYQLTTDYDKSGRVVLDLMLAEMENHTGKLLFILAGYNKEMEKFFEHNPGIKSRVPQQFQFDDYTDEELMDIMERRLTEKYRRQLVVEDGMRGLYSRIAIRRVGRGRGRPGFGNARALQNMLDRVTDRQAKRVALERRQNLAPDVFFLSKEDLVVDPTKAMKQSKALSELHSLTGLRAVKDAVDNFVQLVIVNYQRELVEKEPIMIPLNRVFLGSPGTGKTTVAKLYGQILADLGMISNGEVVVKNPSDFIGAHLGSSERNTKKILASTVGKVLVIDEAYMLGGSRKDSGNHTDSFKTAVIDTIVAEVQNVPGDDRCVLLLGYEEEMENMFQNTNPGLVRRFQMEEAFRFEDFTMPELMQILDQKMLKQELDATGPGKKVAEEVLDRLRNRPNFGNGGEVENLLGKAKQNYQARHKTVPIAQRPIDTVFEPVDFDKDFDRASKASENLTKMFEGIIGCDHIIEKLRDYQNIAQVRKAQGKDPKEVIPMNFVFKGPPGTGKTTVARKMGQVYFDMGFLASADVEECSASDLVGQYIGHTGPKTQKLFEKALGKVLFIDEAYRLAAGHFAQEAMDEIVTVMTQEKFKGKLIVILAGYEHDINKLMKSNSGLSSRFPEELMFYNLSPEDCLDVLKEKLKKEDIQWARLEDKSTSDFDELKDIVKEMSDMPSWGNARDIGTIAQLLCRVAYKQGLAGQVVKPLVLDDQAALDCINEFWRDRRYRAANLPRPDQRPKPPANPPMASSSSAPPPPPPPNANTNTNTNSNQSGSSGPKPPTGKTSPPPARTPSPPARTPPPPPRATPPRPRQPPSKPPSTAGSRPSTPASPAPSVSSPLRPQAVPTKVQRDAGVTDDVWNAFQAARQAQDREDLARKQQQKKLEQDLKRAEQAERDRQKNLRVQEAKAAADAQEQQRLEQMRRKLQQAKAEEQKRRQALEAHKRKEQEEQRKREQAQKKLRQMGVCVQGYQWHKIPGGYRCAGGSHFVSDAQLR
ncbi:P-loop containing nucleoside triphosphate hydrolase protein [Schizophyllum amplum]|uniref:P-loop containing nucleoside triphosphate hydrolase protein n=1 Tax=Schizophyllum amplum TaxID=97359 RepID=A0A550CIC7_9AGAR|nr:P-loop containing nucleoside triphosphate hydrolase protein [Auriculariopsis ampla]